MNNISEYTKCSNCGACHNICPADAIKVNKDDVYYSVCVDENKCTECGLCKKVCPVNTPENQGDVISAYGGRHKDSSMIKNSSSGGAFSAIADEIIANGGVVYGACYDNNCKEVLIKGSDETDVSDMRKSKYVESQVGLIFRQIKEKLENGVVVLFTGAPCQVAGLKRYLRKDYSNLYTCDFICGGMASHQMYQDYLETLEKKYKSETTAVDFRPKIIGWNSHYIKIDFKNNKKYESDMSLDPYFYGFVQANITMRDYCFHCDFAENHYSDIILADFWRYKQLSSFPTDNEGLSMMLVNSQKGEELIKSIAANFEMESISVEGACAALEKRTYSKEHMDRRDRFIACFRKKGIFKTADVFYKPSLNKVIKKKIKAVIKKLEDKK